MYTSLTQMLYHTCGKSPPMLHTQQISDKQYTLKLSDVVVVTDLWRL